MNHQKIPAKFSELHPGIVIQAHLFRCYLRDTQFDKKYPPTGFQILRVLSSTTKLTPKLIKDAIKGLDIVRFLHSPNVLRYSFEKIVTENQDKMVMGFN
jgi:hypothetical protein